MPSRPADEPWPARPADPLPRHRDGQRLHVLLMLSNRIGAETVQQSLRARSTPLQVSTAHGLTEAMVAVAACAPALAVVDAALCDGLEREFVEHLLQSDPGTQVLILGAERECAWCSHPRLAPVAPAELLAAVEAWSGACVGVGCGR